MAAEHEAILKVKLDVEEVARQLGDLAGKFDVLKKIKELEFAVGAAEREAHKLLLRVADLEERVKINEIWQEDKDRSGCEE